MLFQILKSSRVSISFKPSCRTIGKRYHRYYNSLNIHGFFGHKCKNGIVNFTARPLRNAKSTSSSSDSQSTSGNQKGTDNDTTTQEQEESMNQSLEIPLQLNVKVKSTNSEYQPETLKFKGVILLEGSGEDLKKLEDSIFDVSKKNQKKSLKLGNITDFLQKVLNQTRESTSTIEDSTSSVFEKKPPLVQKIEVLRPIKFRPIISASPNNIPKIEDLTDKSGDKRMNDLALEKILTKFITTNSKTTNDNQQEAEARKTNEAEFDDEFAEYGGSSNVEYDPSEVVKIATDKTRTGNEDQSKISDKLVVKRWQLVEDPQLLKKYQERQELHEEEEGDKEEPKQNQNRKMFDSSLKGKMKHVKDQMLFIPLSNIKNDNRLDSIVNPHTVVGNTLINNTPFDRPKDKDSKIKSEGEKKDNKTTNMAVSISKPIKNLFERIRTPIEERNKNINITINIELPKIILPKTVKNLPKLTAKEIEETKWNIHSSKIEAEAEDHEIWPSVITSNETLPNKKIEIENSPKVTLDDIITTSKKKQDFQKNLGKVSVTGLAKKYDMNLKEGVSQLTIKNLEEPNNSFREEAEISRNTVAKVRSLHNIAQTPGDIFGKTPEPSKNTTSKVVPPKYSSVKMVDKNVKKDSYESKVDKSVKKKTDEKGNLEEETDDYQSDLDKYFDNHTSSKEETVGSFIPPDNKLERDYIKDNLSSINEKSLSHTTISNLIKSEKNKGAIPTRSSSSDNIPKKPKQQNWENRKSLISNKKSVDDIKMDKIRKEDKLVKGSKRGEEKMEDHDDEEDYEELNEELMRKKNLPVKNSSFPNKVENKKSSKAIVNTNASKSSNYKKEKMEDLEDEEDLEELLDDELMIEKKTDRLKSKALSPLKTKQWRATEVDKKISQHNIEDRLNKDLLSDTTTNRISFLATAPMDISIKDKVKQLVEGKKKSSKGSKGMKDADSPKVKLNIQLPKVNVSQMPSSQKMKVRKPKPNEEVLWNLSAKISEKEEITSMTEKFKKKIEKKEAKKVQQVEKEVVGLELSSKIKDENEAIEKTVEKLKVTPTQAKPDLKDVEVIHPISSKFQNKKSIEKIKQRIDAEVSDPIQAELKTYPDSYEVEQVLGLPPKVQKELDREETEKPLPPQQRIKKKASSTVIPNFLEEVKRVYNHKSVSKDHSISRERELESHDVGNVSVIRQFIKKPDKPKQKERLSSSDQQTVTSAFFENRGRKLKYPQDLKRDVEKSGSDKDIYIVETIMENPFSKEFLKDNHILTTQILDNYEKLNKLQQNPESDPNVRGFQTDPKLDYKSGSAPSAGGKCPSSKPPSCPPKPKCPAAKPKCPPPKTPPCPPKPKCPPPPKRPPACPPPKPACPPPKPACPPPKPACPPPKPACPPPKPKCPPPKPACPPPKPACPPPKPACPPPKPACPPPKPACGSPKPKCPPPKPACGSPKPKCPPPKPACGSPKPACGSPKPACGSPKPACGSPKPACGSPKPACGSPKPACGSPKPACGSSKPACGSSKPKCPPKKCSAPEPKCSISEPLCLPKSAQCPPPCPPKCPKKCYSTYTVISRSMSDDVDCKKPPPNPCPSKPKKKCQPKRIKCASTCIPKEPPCPKPKKKSCKGARQAKSCDFTKSNQSKGPCIKYCTYAPLTRSFRAPPRNRSYANWCGDKDSPKCPSKDCPPCPPCKKESEPCKIPKCEGVKIDGCEDKLPKDTPCDFKKLIKKIPRKPNMGEIKQGICKLQDPPSKGERCIVKQECGISEVKREPPELFDSPSICDVAYPRGKTRWKVDKELKQKVVQLCRKPKCSSPKKYTFNCNKKRIISGCKKTKDKYRFL